MATNNAAPPPSETRLLLMADFDHTIIHDNSDLWIRRLLPSHQVPVEIQESHKQHENWTQFMSEIFAHMHSLGVTPLQVMECMHTMSFVPGMIELIEYQQSNAAMDCIVVSDSNSIFINTILDSKGLLSSIKAVYTNPAEFDETGCLRIRPYHQHNCKSCPANLCKGAVLRTFLEQQEKLGITYSRIFLVGDGSNDFCPVPGLGVDDVVFPRQGYRLLRMIQKMMDENKAGGEDNLKAAVFPWDNGFRILEFLLKS